MKNKKLLLFILLLGVALSAYYYFNQRSKNTLAYEKGAKFDFAIEDTNSITKIFIADAKGEKVTLIRKEKNWLVNEKYPARPDNIRLLMKTFSRIALKYPVPKASFETVVKNIASGATKVEIYQGKNTPSKIYYIGNSTMDQTGTYMLLETEGVKSTAPFIMHIPGFRGFLSSRFFANADEWRNPAVFVYEPNEIKKIELTYFEDKQQSFSIERTENELILLDYTNKKVDNCPKERLEEYVGRYKKIYYEMMDLESSKEKKDSIINSTPVFNIKINDIYGETKEITTYHMPNFRETINPANSEPYNYDIDRMYALVNKELFVFVQFATFNEITVKKDNFLIKE